jgi:hypothetical protein
LIDHRALAPNLVAVANSLTVVAQHLSGAIALIGDNQHALIYAGQALAVPDKVHFRPEQELARLQLAKLLSLHLTVRFSPNWSRCRCSKRYHLSRPAVANACRAVCAAHSHGTPD